MMQLYGGLFRQAYSRPRTPCRVSASGRSCLSSSAPKLATCRRGRIHNSNGVHDAYGAKAMNSSFFHTSRRPFSPSSPASWRRMSQKMQRPSRAKYAWAPSSSSSARLGTIGRAISWEWGCASDAPACRPWLRNSSRYLNRGSPSRSRYRSRYIHSTEASWSGAITPGCAAWSGVSTMTSCAPTPPMPSYMPSQVTSVEPSMRSAGYLFGTTRTCQPGVSGAVPGRRIAAISGGVVASRPSQNGQLADGAASGSPPLAKSLGRAARSLAMITQRRVMGSLRSSGTVSLRRGGVADGAGSGTDAGAPRGDRAPVRLDVPPGGAAPREVLSHTGLLQLLPDAAVAERAEGPLECLPQRGRLVRLEHESVGDPAHDGVRGRVHDRVRQPARLAHHRDGAVAQAVQLVEARRLVPGRHEEHVRAGLDAVGQRVVEPERHGDAPRVARPEGGEQFVVLGLAGAEEDELRAPCDEAVEDGGHEIEALLVREPADHADERGVRRVIEVLGAPQVARAGHLAGEVAGGVARRDVRVGRRVPGAVIDAVQDAGEIGRALAQHAFESAPKLRRLDLMRVLLAHGAEAVGEYQSALQQIHLAVELDALRCEQMRAE